MNYIEEFWWVVAFVSLLAHNRTWSDVKHTISLLEVNCLVQANGGSWVKHAKGRMHDIHSTTMNSPGSYLLYFHMSSDITENLC